MMKSATKCPFCPPNLNRTEIILENAHCIFLQAEETILIGSGVIIPKKHRRMVFDMTPDEWQDTFSLLHEAKALLDRQYSPDGYNIGWNCGRVGGQEVFHAHLHVIPRYKNEPLAGKGIRFWLKQEINRRS